MESQNDRIEAAVQDISRVLSDVRVSVARLEERLPNLERRVDDAEVEAANLDSDVSELKETQDQASGAVRAIGFLGGTSFLMALVTAIVAWAKGH